MSEKTRNLVVGATALVGVVAGLYLLLLFGYVPRWLEGGYEIRVRLTNASGLTEGSRVRLSGIDIGRVSTVMLSDSVSHGVEVVALIREGIRVPKAVRVEAQSPLLGGNPSLAFDVEPLTVQQMRDLLPDDNSAVIEGYSLTLASQFAGELEAAIRQPAREFEKLVERFDRLGEKWTEVGGNINRLIELRSVDDVDSGEAAGNVATMIARADQRLGELKSVIAGLDQWINDKQLRDDMAATVANARRLTRAGHESLQRLESRYVAVADDLAAVIESARVVIDNARAGRGTVGKLFGDPSLYDNLNDTAQRLQEALDEFRLLVGKWKAEGMPVQF